MSLSLGSSLASKVYLGATEIKGAYLGATQVYTSFVSLLDLYPATAAYSAYDLGNKRGSVTESEGTVVNPVQRWRRGSDGALQMFTAEDIDDGTALTWAGTTAYLLTAYDQSGNDYDLTQTTAANQPLVVSGGALTVDGLGNVAPLWDGVNDGLKTTANYTDTVTEFGVFIVSENTTNTGQKTMVRIRANGAAGTVDGVIWEQGWSNAASRYGANTFYEGGGNVVSPVTGGVGTQDTDTHINSLLYEQSQILAYDDGSLETTMTTVPAGSLPTGNVTFSNPIWLGYNFDSGNRAFGGSIAAMILYNTDQSANRADIEAKLSTIVTTAIS